MRLQNLKVKSHLKPEFALVYILNLGNYSDPIPKNKRERETLT
jgi:hypothetical protein